MTDKAKVIDFFKVLRIGIEKLEDKNIEFNCFTVINNALNSGILEYKKRLNTIKNTDEWSLILNEKFKENFSSFNKETGSLVLDLTTSYVRPNKLECIELHVFLTNSRESYRALLQNIDSILFEADITAFADLEIIGKNDSRFCSAQLNFYGPDATSSAISAANIIDKVIGKDLSGYKLSELYPIGDDFHSCIALNKGRFQKRKDNILNNILNIIKENELYFIDDIKNNYETLVKEYRSAV